MAPRVYDRLRMETLLFLEHGQFAWVHGALQSLTQHYRTRCRRIKSYAHPIGNF